MIFVTTGTHYLPFNRLLKMIDLLVKKSSVSEEIIIQSGTSKMRVKNARIIPFLSHQDTIKYIAKARLVITAAGPATIFQVLYFNKNLPLVVPRLKKYGEHVSDHQLSFAKYLAKRSLCKLILSDQELVETCKNNQQTKSKTTLSPSKKLIVKLEKYLQ